MDNVLRNILELINERELTDIKFQKDLGFYDTMVSEWKNGKSKSYLKHLPRISEYFGVSADHLLGKEEQKEEEPIIINRLKKDINNMDESIQKKFSNAIKEQFKEQFEEPPKATDKKADYEAVYNRVSFLLKNCLTITIPVDIFSIANELNNLKLVRYSELAIKTGIPIMYCSEFLGSRLGSYVENDGKAFIYYNDTLNDIETARFTIAKELSHFVLGHKKYIDVNEVVYEELEKESDCFARNLLAPACLIEAIGINANDVNMISNTFKISKEAAQIRSSFYEIDKNRLEDEDLIVARFYNSIKLLKNE